jgi:hypothetical protein
MHDLLTSDVWTARMKRAITSTILLLLGIPGALHGQQEMFKLEGAVTSGQGDPIADAVITTSNAMSARSNDSGHFILMLPRGVTHLVAQAAQYSTLWTDLDIESDQTLNVELLRNETVTVHGEPDVLSPDPSATAYTRGDLLAANPGQPGVPFSVPGFPTDTASGGIKAPQYFAPGVAGDHG